MSKRKEIEGLLESGRLDKGVEMLLKDMLRFLGDMPVDKYHDYRDFRHRGLVDYLVFRFMREKWSKQLKKECR